MASIIFYQQLPYAYRPLPPNSRVVARAIRMGYNVMAMDTDVMLLRGIAPASLA